VGHGKSPKMVVDILGKETVDRDFRRRIAHDHRNDHGTISHPASTKHPLMRDIPAYMSVVVPLGESRYWNKQQQLEESGI